MPTKRQDKHGYWYINYTWESKRVRKSFGPGATGKKLAELALANITLKIQHKKMGVVEDIPAEQFFLQYLDYSRTNKALRSYERDVTIISNIADLIEGKKLSQIRAQEIEAYKTKRLREVKESTINRELNTIKAAFNKAVEWGYLTKNPLTSVKRFKEPKTLRRFFSLQEIKLFLGAIEDPWLKSAVYLLLFTGMRRDELMHLEWTDIDFGRGVLHVQPKPDWNPKDYEARVIPLNNQVKELLLSLLRTGDNRVLGSRYPTSLSRAFKRTLRRAGIKDAHLHTLRHTYASHLVMSGVDIATVQKLLGHSKINTTMKYAHLSPEHLQDAARKLDKVFCFEPKKKQKGIILPYPRKTRR